MKKSVASLLIGTLLLPSAMSLALPLQTGDNALTATSKGDNGALKIKVAELPDDAVPVDLVLAGSAGLGDIFQIYGGVGIGTDPMVEKLVGYVSAYWLTGKEVEWKGTTYLLAYRSEVTPALLNSLSRSSSKVPEFQLRLILVNKAAVVSITPRPDLTKAEWVALSAKSHQDGRDEAVSNMKQIGLAAIMYSNDFDDYMPNAHSAAQALEKIQPYLKNMEITKSLNPNGGRIAFNLHLAAVSATTLGDLSKIPMFYDSEAWPDGGRPVVFGDGHVHYVTAEEWPAVLAELQRTFPRAKPAAAKLKKK